MGYALALVVLVVFALIGLAAAFMLSTDPVPRLPEPEPMPA